MAALALLLEHSFSSDWRLGQVGCQQLGLPCFQSKEVFTHSLRAECRLPKGPLLVHLALEPAKGAHLLCIECQVWGTQHVAHTSHSSGKISASVIASSL